MISFIRETLALPVQLLFFLMRYLLKKDSRQLSYAIWRISGSRKDAVNYYRFLYGENVKTAQDQIEILLRNKNDGRYYTDLCYLDLWITGRESKSIEWLEQAYSNKCSHGYMLLYIELSIATDNSDVMALSNTILERNDLPLHFTKLAHGNLIQEYIRLNETEKAQDLINMISEIEDPKGYLIYQLALDIKKGAGDFETYRKQIKLKRDDQYNVSFAHACYLADQIEECRKYLGKCSPDHLKTIHTWGPFKTIIEKTLQEKAYV